MIREIEILITDSLQLASGQWRYGWTQVLPDSLTGIATEQISALSGSTTVNPALERNNAQVAIGRRVRARQYGYIGSQMCWVFTASSGLATDDNAGDPITATSDPINDDSTTQLLIYPAPTPDFGTPFSQLAVTNNDPTDTGLPQLILALYPWGLASIQVPQLTVYDNGPGDQRVHWDADRHIWSGSVFQQYYDANNNVTATFAPNQMVVGVIVGGLTGGSESWENDGGVVQKTITADRIVLDAPDVQAPGLPVGSGTLIASALAQSNVASIALTGLTGYKFYRVICYGFQSKNALGETLRLRTSSNNGVSYDSGAADYSTGGVTASSIPITTGNPTDGTATNNAAFEMILSNIANTSHYKIIRWAGSALSSTTLTSMGVDPQAFRVSASAINAIEFTGATANINGNVLVYGYN